MTYNLDFFDNSTSLYDFTTGANAQASYTIGIATLIVVYIVLFIWVKRFDTKASFLIVSFATTILALLEFFMLWITEDILYIFIMMTVIALFVYVFGRD